MKSFHLPPPLQKKENITKNCFRGAGDAYVSRYNDKIKDGPHKVKIVDDTCIFSKDFEQSF